MSYRTFPGFDAIIPGLMSAGMEAAEAGRKAALFEKCLQLVGAGAAPARAFFVPGRVEFLGKHTDYAGGRSLLCTVERGFCVVATPRPDDQIGMTDALTRDAGRFALSTEVQPRPGHWLNYAITVAHRAASNFPGQLRGAEIVFASDLPSAAGISSSSALVVGTWLALECANDLSRRSEYLANVRCDEDLAGYLGTVENGQTFGTLVGQRGVGTFGGSEDHTAILCARPDALVQYSFCPVRFERSIQLPTDHVLVIGCSGVVAEKTGAAMARYNRVAAAAATVLEQWNNYTGRSDRTLAAAAAGAPDALEHMRDIVARSRAAQFTPGELAARLEQFIEESERIIPRAGEALAAGDLAALGECVDRSQRLAETNLGNQVPQTVHLARAARQLGAVAASAFGAGFGGSAWALVRRTDAAAFRAAWENDYAAAFPTDAARGQFFISRAGPAAMTFA